MCGTSEPRSANFPSPKRLRTCLLRGAGRARGPVAALGTHSRSHQASRCSSCSSSIRLHSKSLLPHRRSTISRRRTSLQRKPSAQQGQGTAPLGGDVLRPHPWHFSEKRPPTNTSGGGGGNQQPAEN